MTHLLNIETCVTVELLFLHNPKPHVFGSISKVSPLFFFLYISFSISFLKILSFHLLFVTVASTGLFSFNTIFCIGTRIVLPKYRSHHINHAQPPLEVSTVNYKSFFFFFLSLAHTTLQILIPICITNLLQSTLSLARVHATTFSS